MTVAACVAAALGAPLIGLASATVDDLTRCAVALDVLRRFLVGSAMRPEPTPGRSGSAPDQRRR